MKKLALTTALLAAMNMNSVQAEDNLIGYLGLQMGVTTPSKDLRDTVEFGVSGGLEGFLGLKVNDDYGIGLSYDGFSFSGDQKGNSGIDYEFSASIAYLTLFSTIKNDAEDKGFGYFAIGSGNVDTDTTIKNSQGGKQKSSSSSDMTGFKLGMQYKVTDLWSVGGGIRWLADDDGDGFSNIYFGTGLNF